MMRDRYCTTSQYKETKGRHQKTHAKSSNFSGFQRYDVRIPKAFDASTKEFKE
jgi:hypothetical protein